MLFPGTKPRGQTKTPPKIFYSYTFHPSALGTIIVPHLSKGLKRSYSLALLFQLGSNHSGSPWCHKTLFWALSPPCWSSQLLSLPMSTPNTGWYVRTYMICCYSEIIGLLSSVFESLQQFQAVLTVLREGNLMLSTHLLCL